MKRNLSAAESVHITFEAMGTYHACSENPSHGAESRLVSELGSGGGGIPARLVARLGWSIPKSTLDFSTEKGNMFFLSAFYMSAAPAHSTHPPANRSKQIFQWSVIFWISAGVVLVTNLFFVTMTKTEARDWTVDLASKQSQASDITVISTISVEKY